MVDIAVYIPIIVGIGNKPYETRVLKGEIMASERVQTLGREAIELMKGMLKNEFNRAQCICATERIRVIVSEIGGSARELAMNAQTELDQEKGNK